VPAPEAILLLAVPLARLRAEHRGSCLLAVVGREPANRDASEWLAAVDVGVGGAR
jgi:hypothetical protein